VLWRAPWSRRSTWTGDAAGVLTKVEQRVEPKRRPADHAYLVGLGNPKPRRSHSGSSPKSFISYVREDPTTVEQGFGLLAL